MEVETADDPIERLIDEAYRRREPAWQHAIERACFVLNDARNEVLHGCDLSRLDEPRKRIKHRDRVLDKARRKVAVGAAIPSEVSGLEELITDLVGVKVLCKSTRDQRALIDKLLEDGFLEGMELAEDPDDYIDAPKPSGYRAWHCLLMVPVDRTDPVRVEVQVKTRLQDAWGELTHEDLYKPGAAIRPTPFHHSVARTMAGLLAEVDRLADDLAAELERTVDASTAVSADPNRPVDVDWSAPIQVNVRTTGPKYALAVDSTGRQGLIPARAVRDLTEEEFIVVSDYLEVGDQVDVEVDDDGEGVIFRPVTLPTRSSLGSQH